MSSSSSSSPPPLPAAENKVTTGGDDGGSTSSRHLTIGVFGGSFNPIHLGHTLLAVTTQQTKDYVDHVVLVPVYQHAVKRNLLPFDDRVHMCQLAVQNFEHISVSTIEQTVGASNGVMLQGLKAQYPTGTRFIWICGDDFFQWMHKPKGLETLAQVDGLIVQRRLHRQPKESHPQQQQPQEEEERFYKDPIDETRVRQIALQMNLRIDYIYGELPHFSSTLVRRAPGHWRSFLTNAVTRYLDERPHLQQQLWENLQAADEKYTQGQTSTLSQQQQKPPPTKKHKRMPSLVEGHSVSSVVILGGLEAIHALQKERGYTALFLSMATENRDEANKSLNLAQRNTDRIVQEMVQQKNVDLTLLADFKEGICLANELQRIPLWLALDRQIVQDYHDKHTPTDNHIVTTERTTTFTGTAPEALWLQRLGMVEKFNPRIDVLIGMIVHALTEILHRAHEARQTTKTEQSDDCTPPRTTATSFSHDVPELFQMWLDAKEALGRERAFFCAGGSAVPQIVRSSYKLRERSIQTIDTKERMIDRVLSLQAGLDNQHAATMTAPKALHRLLEQLSRLEYSVLRTFGYSTPLSTIHKLLLDGVEETKFDVIQFFSASTAAIDFLLSFAKALAAASLAGA